MGQLMLYLILLRAKGLKDQALHPGISFCGRCWHTWKTVEPHSTLYAEGRGCFPLCESCWQALTPESRLPFYRKLYDSWVSLAGQTLTSASLPAFEDIKQAVMKGE